MRGTSQGGGGFGAARLMNPKTDVKTKAMNPKPIEQAKSPLASALAAGVVARAKAS
jgi:hypothetical protein